MFLFLIESNLVGWRSYRQVPWLVQRGSTGMALLIFHLGTQRDSVVCYKLYVRKKNSITHRTGNWVGLGSGLDRYKEWKISCPHRVRPSSPYKITIPIILPGHLQPNVRHTRIWMFNTTNLKNPPLRQDHKPIPSTPHPRLVFLVLQIAI